MIKELFDVGEQHTDPTELDLQLTKHEDNIAEVRLWLCCSEVAIRIYKAAWQQSSSICRVL